MKSSIIFLVSIFFYFSASGQNRYFTFGFKAIVELNSNYKQSLPIGFRLAAHLSSVNNYGIGNPNISSPASINHHLSLDGVFFSTAFGRPLITKSLNRKKYFGFDLKFSQVAEIGFGNKNLTIIPIINTQYSSSFSSNSDYSIQTGFHFILTNGNPQWVVSIGSILKSFHFGYFNDGGPFIGPITGDHDKYWTGGGYVGYTFNKGIRNQILWEFTKYTGEPHGAHKFFRALRLEEVIYEDKYELSMNCNRMSITYFNQGIELGIAADNFKSLDIQRFIHDKISYGPYHARFRNGGLSIYGGYSNVFIQ